MVMMMLMMMQRTIGKSYCRNPIARLLSVYNYLLDGRVMMIMMMMTTMMMIIMMMMIIFMVIILTYFFDIYIDICTAQKKLFLIRTLEKVMCGSEDLEQISKRDDQ